ncbi:seminase [Drosophila busckii]|uniref:seminase n=1 Tax=Drosophila busckii TaxID=30019 RepID=UPI00083EFFB2|nr:seminase [Drosophila busckii]
MSITTYALSRALWVGFVVNLRNNGRFSCGGTLVHRLHVVTAAHCVAGIAASRLSVQAGVSSLSERGQIRRVSRYFVPPAYNSNSYNWDVAVVRLQSAITGINVAPLCSSQWRAGAFMRVSGWGATRYGNSGGTNQLRTVQLQIIRRDTCQRRYGSRTRLQPSNFCAFTRGRDACTGDSGTGAIYNNQLCGIVSVGLGCASGNFPGIYTSINVARSFINGIIRS